MTLQHYWYLGFLGSIGIITLPASLIALTGFGPWYDALNLLWLGWFLYFVPNFPAED